MMAQYPKFADQLKAQPSKSELIGLNKFTQINAIDTDDIRVHYFVHKP
jgi:hypothetical protein